MNPSIESQRINVRKHGIKEVLAKASALGILERTAGGQIIEGGRKDPHPHPNLLLSDCFAVSHSNTCSPPSASRRSVAANSFACQAGDSNSPSGRLNSSQSVSISFSFSLRGSWRKLSIVMLPNLPHRLEYVKPLSALRSNQSRRLIRRWTSPRLECMVFLKGL